MSHFLLWNPAAHLFGLSPVTWWHCCPLLHWPHTDEQDWPYVLYMCQSLWPRDHAFHNFGREINVCYYHACNFFLKYCFHFNGFSPTIQTEERQGSWFSQSFLPFTYSWNIIYAKFCGSKLKVKNVKMFTTDEQRTTNENRQRQIAIFDIVN